MPLVEAEIVSNFFIIIFSGCVRAVSSKSYNMSESGDGRIGHFRVAVNFTMKARLSAKRFISILVLFEYE